ncbi:MAG: metallophosphoesterase [Candidatus Saccharimonadales bacterium]
MPSTKHKLRKKLAQNKGARRFLIFILLFAIIASVAIIATRAASPDAIIEPENGSITTPAIAGSDINASGGKYVQFKKIVSTGSSYTIVGAGDIADGTTDSQKTGDYIRSIQSSVSAVLTFGDDAYSNGSPSDFTSRYEPTWGSFKSITYPSPGNHDYNTSGATGYYSYFNATATTITGHTVSGVPNKGYYAFDIGNNWRFYSLNTEANQSEANTWLDSDLKAHPKQCVTAYWHQPAYTSTSDHGSNSSAVNYFKTLYNNNADIVFVGHNHAYERMYPMNGSGVRDDAKGIVDLTVGTGGAGEESTYTIRSPFWPASAKYTPQGVWGVIKLTANDNGSYTLDFVKTSGTPAFSDSYSGTCH